MILGRDKENNESGVSSIIISRTLLMPLLPWIICPGQKVDNVYSLGLSNKCEQSNGVIFAER